MRVTGTTSGQPAAGQVITFCVGSATICTAATLPSGRVWNLTLDGRTTSRIADVR
jgi:hypothetical protein